MEWRISTITALRIDPEVTDGKRWYRVRVACDGEMTCRALHAGLLGSMGGEPYHA